MKESVGPANEEDNIDTWMPPLPPRLPVRVDASEDVWDKLLEYLWDDEDEKEVDNNGQQ